MSLESEASNRVIAGILRLGELLGSSLTSAGNLHRLSSLQLQILSYLSTLGQTSSVGSIAIRLQISAATASDSLRVLAVKGLITKSRRPDDARGVEIGLSGRGREVVAHSAVLQLKLRKIVAGWDRTRHAEVLPAVLALINGLQRDPEESVDRICLGCEFFAINCETDGQSAPYFCRHFQSPLHAVDLRVDCPEFKPLSN